jgi:hypothetical protein
MLFTSAPSLAIAAFLRTRRAEYEYQKQREDVNRLIIVALAALGPARWPRILLSSGQLGSKQMRGNLCIREA